MRFRSGGTPAASVVICAFRAGRVINGAIESLRRQDFPRPFEVVAVISGDDGCADMVRRTHPDVRVVGFDRRLHPGGARNAGVGTCAGRVIAFLPADGVATRGWLGARVAAHERGAPLVGGAITNGTPRSAVGTASYYVEYAGSVPSRGVLSQQVVPHTLSYTRDVFEALGKFPEIEVPGEDTLFNDTCVRAGLPVVYEPRASICHRNLTALVATLRHQREHGRGLARCVLEHELACPFPRPRNRVLAVLSVFGYYPAWRWTQTALLFARHDPKRLLPLVLLTPLILAGYVAGACGTWDELSARERHSSRQRSGAL
jgi:hypothetical protein